MGGAGRWDSREMHSTELWRLVGGFSLRQIANSMGDGYSDGDGQAAIILDNELWLFFWLWALGSIEIFIEHFGFFLTGFSLDDFLS